MKTFDEFKLTNEMLDKVIGGGKSFSQGKFFAFNGAYAEQQARNVHKKDHMCGCGCGCSSGAGNGSGAGS